ncbi:PHP domain-containing protein, partial [Thiohalomonas denitrificans]|uniref:PHP domain-containing protein n=1 Tax=Thiohalomonas denitrificans TaxID=415747 RepID=UPI0026EB856D
MCDYAELHCLSNFTFLRGASHAEELVVRAAELGYSALAVTDECSLAGVVRAYRAAKEQGLHLIVGSEVRLEDGIKLVLLASDREGYGNLSELITLGRRRSEKGAYRLGREDLADGVPGCLVLWLPPDTDTRDEGRGARENETSESVAAEGNQDFRGFRRSYGGEEANAAEWVAGTFPGRAWIAVELHCGADDAGKVARCKALGEASGLPLVAAGDVHMHRRGRRALQDLLTAIRLCTTVAEAGAALYANGERHLRPRERLAEIYPAEWLAETTAIAARCRFTLEELKYNYPDEITPPDETPGGYLRRLTETGLKQFWPQGEPEKVRRLVEHELTIIGELGYEPYFLTVYDLVRFARGRGILCQGRGSAANSAVCYCLGITAVDPSRSEMLFERFISKERDEPPDIDVDFEHTRREEVLQYLYERYGRERAALTATVITYRTRSALRDVGKALGLSVNEVDRLAGAFGRWGRPRAALTPQIAHQRVAGRSDAKRAPAGMAVALSRGRNAADGRPAARPEGATGACHDGVVVLGKENNPSPAHHALSCHAPMALKGDLWGKGSPEMTERLSEAGFDTESPIIKRLLVLVWELLDFPRHLSQHVGGMVITRDPLPRLVPIENAAMEGRTVIQWDKDDLDSLGLLKIDCLALGMLSAIHKAFDLVEKHRGRRLTLAAVPAEDPEVYAMLCRADTVGVFQIESRAQMAMLPRLRPRTFYDLVIEVAIIRPGPIQGNMVHPYLKRRQGLEPITYPGPEAEAVLARTLGVPIFQEQVIKLAMVAAGFTAGEADRLRRAIAAWKKGRGLAAFEEKLRSGMAERGYPPEFADQVIEQIKGFGEYGFPESHAASFALLAYISSWLKCHEPAAFTCALLNSQPMGFYAPAQLVRDAREHGVEVLPLDVGASEWDCTIEVASGEWLVARNAVASGEWRVARNAVASGEGRVARNAVASCEGRVAREGRDCLDRPLPGPRQLLPALPYLLHPCSRPPQGEGDVLSCLGGDGEGTGREVREGNPAAYLRSSVGAHPVGESPPVASPPLPVRLGLRMVKGL